MATIGTLVVNFKANSASYERDMKKIRKSTKSTAKSLKSMKAAGAAVLAVMLGFKAAAAALRGLVSAAEAGEKSQAKLNAVLRATGFSAGFAASQIERLVASLAESTLFDDDSLRNAAAQLLTFKNIQGAVFTEGLRLAVDMTALLDGDLKAAVIGLGKALNDPSVGMSMLSRTGITFTATQVKMARAFQKTNQMAKAQKIILDEVRGQLGGVAEAMAAGGGVTPALTQARKAWVDLQEAIVRGRGPVGETMTFIANLANSMFKGLTDSRSPIERQREILDLQKSNLKNMLALKEKFLGKNDEEIQQQRDLVAFEQARLDRLRRLRAEGERDAALGAVRSKQIQEDAAAEVVAEQARKKAAAAEVARIAAVETARIAANAKRNAAVIRAGEVVVEQERKRAEQILAIVEASLEAQVEAERAASLERTRLFQEAWVSAVRNTQTALADFLNTIGTTTNSITDLIRGMVEAWKSAIAEMVSAKILQQLLSLVPILFPGSGAKILPNNTTNAGPIPTGGGGGITRGSPSFNVRAPALPSLAAPPAAGPSAVATATVAGVTIVHNHTWQVQALDARSFDAYLRTQGKASIARVVQEANAESTAFGQGLRR